MRSTPFASTSPPSRAAGSRRAARATCRTFAISDVVGDDLSVIASGPTVADPTTFDDALDVLRRFGGFGRLSGAGRRAPLVGARPARCPKRRSPAIRVWRRRSPSVIGGRRDAMNGAVREAESHGYHVVRIDEPVVGEARTAAVDHLRAAVARVAGARAPGVRRFERRNDGSRDRRRPGRTQSGVCARRGGASRLARQPRPIRRQRRHGRHRRPDRRGRRVRRFDHCRPGPRPPGSTRRARFSLTTTPTRSSPRLAISSAPARPAPTSATSR